MDLSHRRLLLVAAAVAAIQLSTGAAAAPARDLFAGSRSASIAGLPAHAKAGRVITGTLSAAALDSPRLQIPLPDGRNVTAIQEHVARDDANHSLTWTGRIEGPSGGTAVLTRRNTTVAGFVSFGGGTFEVRPAAAGRYILFEVDTARLPEGDEMLQPKSLVGARNKVADGVVGTLSAELNPVVQDLLVVYTETARSRAGQEVLESMISAAVGSANAAYRASAINVTLGLVGMQRISAWEGADMSATLTAAQRDPEIAALRDRFAADMVVLIGEHTDGCGIAYVLAENTTQFPQFAIAYVSSSCLSSNTLAHEIGHLQGMAHDRQTSEGRSGVFPYSFGYRRCIGDGAGFRDIMSYACTNGVSVPRIPQFSNPNILYRGYPTGVSYELDPANSADGTRTLNETAPTIRDFRRGADVPPALPSALRARSVRPGQVDVAWSDNSGNESGFTIERSTDGVSFSEIASVGAGVLSYSDFTVATRTTYAYRVRAYNSSGVSGYSNVAMVTTSSGPQAPTGLRAVAQSGYQVDLSWTDASDDETAFRVERSTDGIGFMLLVTLDANTRSYSDLSVRSATTYHYRVAAQNDDGVSASSNAAIVATPAVAPRPPSGLEASAISRSEISLSWRDNSDNEDGFRIERARDGGDFAEIASVGPDISSYIDLPADTTPFQYRVRAFNGIGTSSPSNVTVATTALPLPQAPGSPVATFSGGQVTLNWFDASDNEQGFRIERSENAVNYVEIATLGANATSYVDSTVKLGITYFYRIRAFNASGPGGAVVAVVSIPAVLLQPPSGLTAAALSSQQVNLEWADNSTGESGFRVERSTGGDAYAVIGNAGANFRNFYDVTTSATTTYTYRVAAFDMYGNSAYSNYATVTTPAAIPPAPLAVTAVNVRKKARVEWVMNGPPLPEAFEVQRETYKKGAWRYAAVVASVPAIAGSFVIDASGKGTFRYSVRACNPAGCSAYVESAAVKVTK